MRSTVLKSIGAAIGRLSDHSAKQSSYGCRAPTPTSMQEISAWLSCCINAFADTPSSGPSSGRIAFVCVGYIVSSASGTASSGQKCRMQGIDPLLVCPLPGDQSVSVVPHRVRFVVHFISIWRKSLVGTRQNSMKHCQGSSAICTAHALQVDARPRRLLARIAPAEDMRNTG